MQSIRTVSEMCISLQGAVMALQEGRGHAEEALRTCYQPLVNKGAGARFRKILFHLDGEYQLDRLLQTVKLWFVALIHCIVGGA
jgi:hypothetical protein